VLELARPQLEDFVARADVRVILERAGHFGYLRKPETLGQP